MCRQTVSCWSHARVCMTVHVWREGRNALTPGRCFHYTCLIYHLCEMFTFVLGALPNATDRFYRALYFTTQTRFSFIYRIKAGLLRPRILDQLRTGLIIHPFWGFGRLPFSISFYSRIWLLCFHCRAELSWIISLVYDCCTIPFTSFLFLDVRYSQVFRPLVGTTTD